MNGWTRFADRLPTPADADSNGVVIGRVRLSGGVIDERPCMWNWIPPSHPYAKELWAVNGWIDWRPSQ